MIKLPDILQRIWCVTFRHSRKNNHLMFFVKSLLRYYTPKCLLRPLLGVRLRQFFSLTPEQQQYALDRVDYYCQFSDTIYLPDDAPALKAFTYRKRENYIHDYVNSSYFFDATEFIRFFPLSLRWAYNPGDINYLFPVPELTKSRPILPDRKNQNNILLNLDKVRHFTWVYDPFTWEEKQFRIIFRGDVRNKPHRQRFLDMWKGHPLCDVASGGNMTIYEHLRYRYIMSLEGNDVASNLKWVMSSNSIAVMPRPKFETWFMEGRLIPNYHYIEIAPDYHDLIDRVTYYEQHPDEAKEIVRHANEWTRQFRSKKSEHLVSLMVLDKYFALTGQRPSTIVGRNLYFVNDLVKLNASQKVNAQGKARDDVMHTMLSVGFQRLDITNPKYSWGEEKRYHHYPWYSAFVSHTEAQKVLRKIKHGDTIFIQDFHLRHMQWLATHAMQKGATVIFLIHDVQCIRFTITTPEVHQLNNSTMLLIHTQAMADKLRSLGVTVPMHVIKFFDYYSSDPMLQKEVLMQHKKEVVFAGNLTKSVFLDCITSGLLDDLKMNLYGFLGEKDFSFNSSFEYKGIFQPDHTGSIVGGWGLVWDGDSILSCEGEYGDYLRYNSSHKASLYLASGIPLIVWSESSLLPFVKEHGIGISISSISEMAHTIASVSDEQYSAILENVRAVSTKLRSGGFLKDAMEKLK